MADWIGVHNNGKAWIKTAKYGSWTLGSGPYSNLQRLIHIGNKISHKPYYYGGAHGMPISTRHRSYDCSSAICTILHRQWFKGRTPVVSGEFVSNRSYDVGSRKPFRGYKGGSIVIFANSGHIWADIWWGGERITFDNWSRRGSHSMWYNSSSAVNRTSGYSNRYYRI